MNRTPQSERIAANDYLSPISIEAFAAYLTCDNEGRSPLNRALVAPRHTSYIVARLIMRGEKADYRAIVWC